MMIRNAQSSRGCRLQLDKRRLDERPPHSRISSQSTLMMSGRMFLLFVLLLLTSRRRDDGCCSAFLTTQQSTRNLFAAAALPRQSAEPVPRVVPDFGRMHAAFRGENNEGTDTNRNSMKEEESIPKDVQFPLAILFLSQFVLFIGVGAVIPAIPLYGQEIGLSQAANGIVISAPAVAMLLLAKFAGNYADVARKPAMLYGMVCIAVADLGTALSTTLPQLFVARLGLGLGRGVSEAGERGMLADLAKRVPQLRGRAVASQQAVIALGIAVGAPVGGIVIEQWGVRAAFLCVTGAALVALALYTLLPETVVAVESNHSQNRNKAERATTTTTTTADKVIQEDEQREVWSTLWKDRRWRGLALAQCGTSFGLATKIATIPILATALLPGGAAGTGLLLSAAGLSGLVGAPLGGWWTDRIGARRTGALSGTISATGYLFIPVVLNHSDGLLGLANNLVATNTAVLPFLDTTLNGQAAAFCALVVLWSLGATAQGPALTAYAQELAPPGSEATALALPRAAGDGTYIVAPLVLGTVADTWTDVTGIECALAGLAILVGSIVMELTGEKE